MKLGAMCFIITLLCSLSIRAQEYQWSVAIKGFVSEETKDNPRAFLWIPQNCKELRGIIFGQHNMCEEAIFDHPFFRKAMSEIGFGIIWISPGIDQEWDVRDGCQGVFDETMAALAVLSGYSELGQIPIVPLGHSAMATFPWNFGAWNPQRTLAIVSYHGDAPRTNLTGYGRENLEWGRSKHIDGIPGLMIEGEYEWWESRVNPALAFKMMYPASCISFLCDAGHGHFDVSDEVVDYITLFIKKACEYRFSKNKQFGLPVTLFAIDPQSGWLAERWHPEQKKRIKPGLFTAYKGDRHDAFWYFDKEMAMATENYYRSKKGKLSQYLGFSQNGHLLPFSPAKHPHFNITALQHEIEGLTFNLSANFTDSTRQSFVKDHDKGLIHIDRICGPVKKINDSTFCIQFYRMGMTNAKRTNDIWLAAINKGGDRYKGVVQQLNIRIDYPLDKGKPQCISFSRLEDIKKGTSVVRLDATTDQKLPVSYYVKEGPAEIDGNVIKILEIPPRAKFPLKVTVVAWQYGVKGLVQSAEPVERSFYINL